MRTSFAEKEELGHDHYKVVMKKVSTLLPTEEINRDRALTLSNKISADGIWTRPMFIEGDTFAVMDGHHRLFAASQLALEVVPCLLLSYDDPRLSVSYWHKAGAFPVEKILHAARNRKLLPYKTTRHVLNAEFYPADQKLSTLRRAQKCTLQKDCIATQQYLAPKWPIC